MAVMSAILAPDIKSVPRSLDIKQSSPKTEYTIRKNRNCMAFTDWPCYLMGGHGEALMPYLHAR